jgi:Protein of unknown function (DUF1214)
MYSATPAKSGIVASRILKTTGMASTAQVSEQPRPCYVPGGYGDWDMLRALRILSVLVVGAALGLLATWATVIRGGMSGTVSSGPWLTGLYTGSSEGGPYLRAHVAVHGLLALGREETMYYTVVSDSDGKALDGNCSYQIEARDPPTRWWSITAYGADDFLIPNAADLYSVSMNYRPFAGASRGQPDSGKRRMLKPDDPALESAGLQPRTGVGPPAC